MLFFHTQLGASLLLPFVAVLAFYSQDVRSAYSQTNIYESRLKNILNNDIAKWAYNPIIINAIKEQNEAHDTLSMIEIEKLDRTWQLQINNVNRPLINEVQNKEISDFLLSKQIQSDGLYREIMVMDNRGLIVGNSIVSTDYWQGDEAKWLKTFKVGPGAIYIDNVKYDDSAQAFQAQASLTLTVGEEAIGSITIGIDTEKIERDNR